MIKNKWIFASVDKQNTLIILGGPTASGKSQVALDLALYYSCPIINADSRQVYKEMNIGVNKPSEKDLNVVPHHLIGHVSIHQDYNVGLYENEAILLIEKLFQSNKKLILVGGTGMYINAVLKGIDPFPEVSSEIKSTIKQLYETHGLEYLKQELILKDPEYAQEVDLQNPRRISRALEVIYSTGMPFSSYRKGHIQPRNFTTKTIFINKPREVLYKKINDRVDQMVQAGMKAEVESLIDFSTLKALQTVGYKEWFDHFNGLVSEQETIEKIKQHTRNYAKRQLTWWKPYQWPEYTTENIADIKNYIDDDKSQ